MLVRQRAASACDPGSRLSFRGTTNIGKNLDLAAPLLRSEKRRPWAWVCAFAVPDLARTDRVSSLVKLSRRDGIPRRDIDAINVAKEMGPNKLVPIDIGRRCSEY